jgi:hypothetical protein
VCKINSPKSLLLLYQYVVDLVYRRLSIAEHSIMLGGGISMFILRFGF